MVAGKRRAEPVRRGGLPAWGWGTIGVAAVLLLAGFTVPMLVGGEPQAPSKSPTEVAPSTPGNPTPTTTAPTPTTTPTPSPTAPPMPTTPPGLPALPPDQPRRLAVGGLLDVGFDAAVGTTSGTLRPASSSEVSRWADRGSPGSPGEDAVVIIGSGAADAAFAPLLRVQPGAKVRLRTDQGTLTYTVAKRLDLKARALVAHPELAARTPGRLVLVAEKYSPSGDRLATDLVVVAILTGADPA